ncbi:hypothetical protein A3Q56_05277 [Intoshia linei]|uniref:40S ribosomal protein S15 n=1 Tax=Intoshia linei TaxID=1819745 RepID=A0A177AYE5_9BILA|nr:hypothetical protein A3Q56_05277 [Intoshia linei]
MGPKKQRTVNMEEIMKKRGKRSLRRYTYRGKDLDVLTGMALKDFGKIATSRVRRKINRLLGNDKCSMKYNLLLKKLNKAKSKATGLDKPEMVRTHLRDMVILPEMVGSVIGVYNGKLYTMVEIKPNLIGHYLGEFSITYKPVKHGRPGIGATHSSRFIPLK